MVDRYCVHNPSGMPLPILQKHSGGGFVLFTEHERSLADAQAEIARLRGALETLETDAHYVFNNPPGECPQIARDVIEWYAGSIRSVLDTK